MGKFLMTYKGEIEKAMKMIAKKKNSIFLGQSVKIPETYYIIH